MDPSTILSYGPHDLQKVSVWLPPNKPSPSRWVVLIHGGAWRDPSITHLNFAQPTIAVLRASHPNLAIASIEYRLSPHPNHVQPPATPATQRRAAVHPDHINDVSAALAALHAAYGLGHDYVLAGHSCGATLAFQSLQWPALASAFPRARYLVGLAGIYDIPAMVKNHRDGPWAAVYRDFVSGAFTADEAVWAAASPVNIGAAAAAAVEKTVLCVAEGDSLVEKEQEEKMRAVCERSGAVVRVMVEGEHDEMWQVGERQAGAIQAALD